MATGTFGLKEVQLLTVFILGLTHGLPGSEAGDIMCLVCDHVDHPSHCDTFGICGHWEVCSTREIVDHHDKIAYRMGCESPELCELYKHAKEMFGRRSSMLVSSDTIPHHCFDCCSDNYCNVYLCDATLQPPTAGIASWNQTTPPVASTTLGGAAVSGHTDLPHNQTVSSNMTKPTGYVLTTPTTANTSFTTISTNISAITNISTSGTNMSTPATAVNTTSASTVNTTSASTVNTTSASTVNTTTSASTVNTTTSANISATASSETPTTTTTLPVTSPTTITMGTTTSNGCPSNNFVRKGSTCYLFDMNPVNWDAARQTCEKQGSDLVSVNTAEEDKVLVEILNNMNPPDTTRGFWLGAFFNATVDHYVWVDGTDLTFQRFNGKSPRHHPDYRLLMINPSLSPLFAAWPWSSDIGALYKRGFVCETLAV